MAMGVLPKGQTWPNTCTQAITEANERLQDYAERHKPWLTYVDVGDRFLTHQVRPVPKLSCSRRRCFSLAYLADCSSRPTHVAHIILLDFDVLLQI